MKARYIAALALGMGLYRIAGAIDDRWQAARTWLRLWLRIRRAP